MIERVIYTEEAEDDVISHYNWYERREPGLGEDFLRCVEACVLSISAQSAFISTQWTTFVEL